MKLDELKRITRHFQNSPEAKNGILLQTALQELGLEPGNLYQELEMTSRYVDTHRDVSHASELVQLHSHTFYEILFCRNSCGAEYLVGAERFRLQKGDIVLVPPGISHRPLLPETMTEPYVRDVLWVSTELIGTVRKMLPREEFARGKSGNLLRTAGTKWEYLGDMIRTGVSEAERKRPGWEAVVIGNTISLLTQLKRAFSDAGTAAMRAEEPELLERAITYIEDNLAEKITLTDAAHHLYVSESTVSQTFRRRMGVSFYRCVTQRRLIAAKTLILQGVPLEQVGERVGFGDYSGFYRAFRQEYGISPRQFRKRQGMEAEQADR